MFSLCHFLPFVILECGAISIKLAALVLDDLLRMIVGQSNFSVTRIAIFLPPINDERSDYVIFSLQ